MSENSPIARSATTFVELDRLFSTVSATAPAEDLALDSYAQLFGHSFGGKSWDELLKHRHVVVLGEPGSGKTTELRQQHQRLRAEGKDSFLIRLDELAVQGWELALTSDDRDRFSRWLRSRETGTFFLDSVDESKLRWASDFQLAIRRLSDAVRPAGLRRARFIVSSRISEWHPETDGAELHSLLAPPPESSEGKGKSANEESTPLLLVQIQPLDRERVGRFARARGIAGADDFLAALDRAHAWEFARRPLDVVDLASFWSRYHRLGSLTEMLEFSVEQNLRESTFRQKTDPLTPEQARAGAETLAAAAFFARRLTFRVPDGALISDALDARACLPANWTEEQVQALLGRPLFDGASYGRIRFHHRRTLEYLAAAWMTRRLASGCGSDELERLLFSTGTQRILRNSMAPLAAWLCAGTGTWSDRLRDWVLEAEPSIHLRFGDPAALGTPFKRRLLAALAERGRQRRWLWMESNPAAASRLANAELEPEIVAMIGDRALAEDLRSEMLQIVRYARLASGGNAALRVIASVDESVSLRVYASAALRDLDDPDLRGQLASIARDLPVVPEDLCDILLETLFPEAVEPALLATILSRTERSRRRTIGIKHALAELLQSRLPATVAPQVLADLVRLAQTPPHLPNNKVVSLSRRFRWVRRSLRPVLLATLRRPSLSAVEVEDAVTALFLVETRDPDDFRPDDKTNELHAASLAHPAVRQGYFWRRFACDAARGKNMEPAHCQVFAFYGRSLQPSADDFPWLVEDLRTRTAQCERTLLLDEAMRAWDWRGRRRAELRVIRNAIAAAPALRQQLYRARRESFLRPLKRRWYQLHHWQLMFRAKCRKAWRHCLVPLWKARNRYNLWRRLHDLEQGRVPGWVVEMTRESSTRSNHWCSDDWTDSERLHGRSIVRAVREGSKRGWRHYTPPLPHEEDSRTDTTNGAIAGLAGLLAAWNDRELDFATLTASDALLVTRYSLHELNGFPPWLTALATQRPEAVDEIFSACLDREWRQATGKDGEPQLLRKLSWLENPVPAVIAARIMELLKAGDPASFGALVSALEIVARQAEPPRATLAELARERLAGNSPKTEAFGIWFAVWLQVDAAGCLPVLEAQLATIDGRQIMEQVCSILSARSPAVRPVLSDPSYLDPSVMVRWIPLVYQYIREADDIDRVGGDAYSPGDRDYAQEYRDALPRALVGSKRPGAAAALRELTANQTMMVRRDWILHLLDEHLRLDAELVPWTEKTVRLFEGTNETVPAGNADFYRLICRRLATFKHLVEGGDLTPRDEVRDGDKEEKLRRMLARHLSRMSAGHYTVVEETEIDRRERPDLRVEAPPLSPIPIEVKWAETPMHELLERLENQLIGQYLRDERNQFGIFFMGRVGGQKTWRHEGQELSFARVTELLAKRAEELVRNHPRAIGVTVVAVDFRPPVRTRA